MFRSKFKNTPCSSLQPLPPPRTNSVDIMNHLGSPTLHTTYTHFQSNTRYNLECERSISIPSHHSQPYHQSFFTEEETLGSESNDESQGQTSGTDNDVLEKIEIVDEQGNVKRTTTTMKARDVFKLSKGLRIAVNVNEYGQPIRAARRVLTRYMMKLVKQPNLCPPDFNDFNEVKNIFGVELLRAVREKFDVSPHENVDNVLISLFGTKFRNNKHQIRKKVYKNALARFRKKLKVHLESSGIYGAELEHRVAFHEWSEVQILEEIDEMEPPLGFANHQWLNSRVI